MENTVRRKKKSQWIDIWKRFRKNKAAMAGLIIIVILILTAIFADFVAPEGYDDQNFHRVNQFPSMQHLMGTDNLGRCVFSRVIFGSRISLQVGFIAVSISMVLGVAIGAIAGFFGQVLDNALMRFMDILLSIPQILLAIAIASAIGPGLINVMIAVGISSIPGYARLVRASVLTLREQEFIEAAKACGGSDFRLIVKHILPNSLAPIIVQATLGLAAAILSAAALSFIGLGIQPPTPEWGAMLSLGRRFLRDFWHMSFFPGLAIVVVVLALNMFGDGLRDALDPKLKR